MRPRLVKEKVCVMILIPCYHEFFAAETKAGPRRPDKNLSSLQSQLVRSKFSSKPLSPLVSTIIIAVYHCITTHAPCRFEKCSSNYVHIIVNLPLPLPLPLYLHLSKFLTCLHPFARSSPEIGESESQNLAERIRLFSQIPLCRFRAS